MALTAGQSRAVDLPVERLAAARPAVSPATRPAPASLPGPAAVIRPVVVDPELARKRRSKTISGYILLGAGAVAGITAAALLGVGIRQGDRAHASYLATRDQAEMDSHWEDVEAGREKVYGGIAITVAAATLGAVAVYQLLSRPSREEAEAGPPAPVNLSPRPGGATLTIGGRF